MSVYFVSKYISIVRYARFFCNHLWVKFLAHNTKIVAGPVIKNPASPDWSAGWLGVGYLYKYISNYYSVYVYIIVHLTILSPHPTP